MKKALLLITFFVSTQVNAWGAREQGILAGASGLWIIQQLTKPSVQQAPQPAYILPQPTVQPAPVYIQPPPQQIIAAPLPHALVTNMGAQPMVAYYCESARLYYPYVHSCNEGWKIYPTN